MRSLARLNRVMDSLRESVRALDLAVQELERRNAALMDALPCVYVRPDADTFMKVELPRLRVLHDQTEGNHRGALATRENDVDPSLGASPRDEVLLPGPAGPDGAGRFPSVWPFRTDLDPSKGVGPTCGVNTQRKGQIVCPSQEGPSATEVAPGPKAQSNTEIHRMASKKHGRRRRPE